MASTAEGRRLTEAHRREQLTIAARADASARILWSHLNVSDLDRSVPAWLAANTAVTERHYAESATLASSYVNTFRAAETGADSGLVVEPDYNAGVLSAALLVAGPVRVKTLIGQGVAPGTAVNTAVAKYVGIVRRQVLAGGRETIMLTAAGDQQAVGYRRVSDGDPCTFCAMLVGRGPVYTSDLQAGSPLYGDAAKFHGGCGCTVEPVYGTWAPTPQEQRYVNEYEDAASQVEEADQAKRASNILPLMRANGSFRDSPTRRNKRGY